jgi:hypothetical protein
MSSIRKRSFLWLISLALFSCDGPSSKSKGETKDRVIQEQKVTISKAGSRFGLIEENNGLKLFALEEESAFPDAELELVTELQSMKVGKNTLQFEVDEFELAEPTEGLRSQMLANSKKGQHVHFILNNGPYQAHYEEEFEVELSEGHNVILAFLSRSYHESVKEQTAFVFEDVVIGEGFEAFDKTEPCLIYSRPKGSYKLSESNRILVDFYLLNAELSSSGMQVELTVDNTVFMLSNWQPYWVEGLKAGEHKFRLRLLDADGDLVEGPFNDSGIRKVVIEE